MPTNSKPNLRKIQAEETRLRILDAALEVFAAKGFWGSSIKDIAEAAGISQGLIYHYFKSKEDLLTATIRHHSFITGLRETLTAREDQPASMVLRELAGKFLDVLDTKQLLVKILIRDVALDHELGDAWSVLFKEGVLLLQKYIELHISRGEFKPHNAEITSRVLLHSVVMFHITRDIFRASNISKEEFIDGTLDTVLKGIENR